jgi:polyferredoxin
VKLVHTVIWAFFATCIVAIPLVAWARRFDVAVLLMAIVGVEVLVLAANAWSCPLTAVAARYTDDRRDNFDIYLPSWLARHNKVIFGSLLAAGMLSTVALWMGWLA